MEKVNSAESKSSSRPSSSSSLSAMMIGFPHAPSGDDISGGGVGDRLTDS